jgi:hypothetical protein
VSDDVEFLVQSQNPMQLSHEELEAFVESLRKAGYAARFVAPRELRGYGVTFWEVVILYVLVKVADRVTHRALDELLDPVIDRFVSWAKQRFIKGLKRQRIGPRTGPNVWWFTTKTASRCGPLCYIRWTLIWKIGPTRTSGMAYAAGRPRNKKNSLAPRRPRFV